MYHAGAYNVGAVVDKIMPKEGTQELIKDKVNKAGWFRKLLTKLQSDCIGCTSNFLHEMVYENCSEIITPNSR